MFQTLLQKWQDQLNTNWSVNFEFIRLQQFKKCKYERKSVMEDPCIIMSMLNSQIVDIKANSRFATYISADGSVFVMGRDFRPRAETTPDVQTREQAQSYKADGDSIYGIPKCINLVQKVHSVALGRNHMILMSNKGQIYGLGSNQYGQLGIPNQLIPTFYDHPMSLQKMYYSQSPMLINFFDSTNVQKTFGN
jgi:alpha-tubulin suppressor-like RCC1 family protein